MYRKYTSKEKLDIVKGCIPPSEALFNISSFRPAPLKTPYLSHFLGFFGFLFPDLFGFLLSGFLPAPLRNSRNIVFLSISSFPFWNCRVGGGGGENGGGEAAALFFQVLFRGFFWDFKGKEGVVRLGEEAVFSVFLITF
ncbi:MAG: hypothetical protein K2K63_00775 [Acetatifactor sp.]|nr:hypothetical protein [Acetatifactor sp.]